MLTNYDKLKEDEELSEGLKLIPHIWWFFVGMIVLFVGIGLMFIDYKNPLNNYSLVTICISITIHGCNLLLYKLK